MASPRSPKPKRKSAHERAHGAAARPTSDWADLVPRARRVLELLEARLDEPASAASLESWAYRFRDGKLEAIEHPDLYPLDSLIGVDVALARLRANAAAFCAGEPYLDVLLYGDRGTGKSSAVRGLLGELGPKGLRLVEVEPAQLFELGALFAALRPRAEKMAVLCDDLSFDEGDPAYRRLKAVLDGGLEARPSNVMLIVTSNRRHLMPTRAVQTQDLDLVNPEETAHERVSLSDRFGLSLPFFGFDRDTYLRIVDHHAAKIGLLGRIDGAQLHARALQLALARGGRSGRTARHACIAILQEIGEASR